MIQSITTTVAFVFITVLLSMAVAMVLLPAIPP